MWYSAFAVYLTRCRSGQNFAVKPKRLGNQVKRCHHEKVQLELAVTHDYVKITGENISPFGITDKRNSRISLEQLVSLKREIVALGFFLANIQQTDFGFGNI